VPPASSLRIGMVAAEASGDLLAAHLMAALNERRPGIGYFGIGGPKMIAQGFDSMVPMDRLGVRGYAEVLRHYREIAGIRDALATRLLHNRPDAFIGVDAPDFNLGLAQRLRDAGVRTIQFVCPSIWAWRAGRTKKIARSVDHVLCLFPFEPAILARGGVDSLWWTRCVPREYRSRVTVLLGPRPADGGSRVPGPVARSASDSTPSIGVGDSSISASPSPAGARNRWRKPPRNRARASAPTACRPTSPARIR